MILSNGMVTAWVLHKALPYPIYIGGFPVHAAQNTPLGNACHNGGPCVSVGRGEASWRVRNLQADDGLPGRVLELVVVEDFYGLPWSRPKVYQCSIFSIQS